MNENTQTATQPNAELAALVAQLSQPLPVYTHARLTCGRVVKLSKECACRTHTGPHWLAADRDWRERNRSAITAKPESVTALTLYGFAGEESARLSSLGYAMQREGVSQLLTADDVLALRAGGEAVEERAGIRPALRKALGLSLNAAEQCLDGRTLRAFRAVWEWSAPRMGGEAGRKHDAFWERHGKAAYYARIQRVRKACGFAPLANVNA